MTMRSSHMRGLLLSSSRSGAADEKLTRGRPIRRPASSHATATPKATPPSPRAGELRSRSFTTGCGGSIRAAAAGGRTTDGHEWPTLHEEATEMVRASYVSYPITYLLREAKAGNLRNSDRILDKLVAIGDGDLSTYIVAEDVIDIVRDNRDYVRATYGDARFDAEFGWLSSIERIGEEAAAGAGAGGGGGDHPDPVSLLEFDDADERSRLVYGVALNRNRRRVTVIFRGTYVGGGTRDWRRNLQVDPCEVGLPGELLRRYGSLRDPMFMHRGFYEYLFRNSERGAYELERYEEIMSNVIGVLMDYPGFKLYVTGHSLGGALALLMAFQAAASTEALIPKPVTCVSVGSPCIGDRHFREAFQMIEREGWIRYLRITNDTDPITYLPPFSWYRHVGMNLMLHQGGGYTISYPKVGHDETYDRFDNWKKLGSILSTPAVARNGHSLSEYLKRLAREERALKRDGDPIYLNGCYRDSEIVGELESNI